MDYKKAYKEALERAEKLHKDAITLQLEQDIKDYEYIFPELKESEDERIRKEITGLIMRPTWQTEKEFNRRKELAVWLEKQGEQKPQRIISAEAKEALYDKLADNAEPKFKVGDWIVSKKYGDLFQIKEVIARGYKLLCPSGNEEINSFSAVDKKSFLWSIAYARPGDVLASSQSIFIFKGFYIAGKPKAYCGVMNGSFIDCPEGCWTNEQCYPATREQQKLLFEKMTEAGYEWDAEKKVLNEIKMQDLVTSENKVTKISDQDNKWSEEDEENYRNATTIISRQRMNAYTIEIMNYCSRCIDWLESIKKKECVKLWYKT